ncbi:hypothetical protein [Stieleria neptunia]|uniref:hypothetical protein n=1 Tax=Stieleria neptunia TaxID=2527979 RepID=UPI0018D21A8B|nr:hypothetical protein [Stieleria neptunia]
MSSEWPDEKNHRNIDTPGQSPTQDDWSGAGDGQRKPIFDQINGEISDDEIRITLACDG